MSAVGTLWAFDIETAHWDEFVLGAAVSDDGRTLVFRTVDQVRDWYLSTGPLDLIVAHNGGRFDLLFLLDACAGIPMTGVLAGASLISLQARGHAECRDSFRLFPMSLDKWTGEKLALDPVLFPGSYESISRNMTAAQWQQLEDYCVQDCRALLHAFGEWCEYGQDIGAQIYVTKKNGDRKQWPRKTLGAVGAATCQAMGCFVDPPLDWGRYESERDAYYGGRVEVYRTHAPAGLRYDVNSMYPWALLHDVPHGAPTMRSGRAATADYAAQKPGAYFATVTNAPERMPLVPSRVGAGIVWATGHIAGWYPLPELEQARALGAKVRVEWSLVYPLESPLYRPYIEHFYAHRQDALERGDKPRADWLKLLMNSLTGKLAQGTEAETLIAHPDYDPIGCAPLGTSHAFVRTSVRVPTTARPIHAAYLTGRSRALLLASLEAADARAIYCDTDANYQTDGTPPGRVHESELGAWKLEGDIIDWRALAPKVYRFDTRDGKGKVKAKGISGIDRAGFDALARGETVYASRGVEGAKTALKRHGRAFVRRNLGRSLQAPAGIVGTRHARNDGTTVALHRDSAGGLSWPGFRDSPRDIIGARLKDMR